MRIILAILIAAAASSAASSESPSALPGVRTVEGTIEYGPHVENHELCQLLAEEVRQGGGGKRFVCTSLQVLLKTRRSTTVAYLVQAVFVPGPDSGEDESRLIGATLTFPTYPRECGAFRIWTKRNRGAAYNIILGPVNRRTNRIDFNRQSECP